MRNSTLTALAVLASILSFESTALPNAADEISKANSNWAETNCLVSCKQETCDKGPGECRQNQEKCAKNCMRQDVKPDEIIKGAQPLSGGPGNCIAEKRNFQEARSGCLREVNGSASIEDLGKDKVKPSGPMCLEAKAKEKVYRDCLTAHTTDGKLPVVDDSNDPKHPGGGIFAPTKPKNDTGTTAPAK